MEFSIGGQFSREISFEKTRIVEVLEEVLNSAVRQKVYHKRITKVYCSFICVSKGFEPFFMVRPLKILRNEPAIEYEIKLDFDVFYNANDEERLKILKHEFISKSKIILDNKRLKDFKIDPFILDIENVFIK
jgi:hypothetical protein